jgi:cellobiose phosphorylase
MIIHSDEPSTLPSRRAVLKAVGAAAASCAACSPTSLLPARPPAVPGARRPSEPALGGWTEDIRNLPAYRFEADLPLNTRDAAGAPYPLDPDPFFLIGNYRISVFTHASGLVHILTGERGWTHVNEPLGSEQNAASLQITREGTTQSIELLGMKGVAADGRRSKRVFGCGYARYELNPDDEIRVIRTLSLAPSGDKDLGVPAFVVHVALTNRGRSGCDVVYEEKLTSRTALMIERRADPAHQVVRFATRVEIDDARSCIVSHVTANSDDPGIMTARDKANKYNLFPPSLAMVYPVGAARNGAASTSFDKRDVAMGATELRATARTHLAAGETRALTFVIGLCPDGSPAEVLDFAARLEAPVEGVHFGEAWRSALTCFQGAQDPVFRRELTWSMHALLAMATYNSFYDETFIPQGMTYDYQMDMTAAPRDHFQHAMAACYCRPSLAKSTLRYVLSKMTEQGEIKYADLGFGRTSNSAWNPSDQQLYLFQSLGEYLRITGDYAFLDERTTYLPREAQLDGTVLEKVERALSYLRDEVGVGPRGLVRLMNSDWSDMVFVDTSVLAYFWTAESHMNSAMVIAVVPNLLNQLERYAAKAKDGDTSLARKIIGSLCLYLQRVQSAFYKDLGQRTFSRRLYFSPSRPFGDDDMHIEPQSFLLQAESFSVERKRVLWTEIQRRLLTGEKLGPRQRERPVVGGTIKPNTSENGGIWYSLAGQTIIGLATFDKAAALSLLRMMTFDNFSKHYPGYWTGLWSAADTVNAAASGELAGLPRSDNGGLWTTFASYCAHPHAWQIYCWGKLAES